MSLSIFDVVFVDFTYIEQLNKAQNERESKDRPALVLEHGVLIELAQITSQVDKYKNNDNSYIIKDWKEASLKQPSLIRFNVKLDLKDVSRASLRRTGRLSNEDIFNILDEGFVDVKSDAVINFLNQLRHDTLQPYKDKLEEIKNRWLDVEIDDNEFVKLLNDLLIDINAIDRRFVYDSELQDLIKHINGFIKRCNSSLEEELVNDEEAFWNMRDSIHKIASDKYDEVNLILDNNEIRPITKDELKNKFAVSIEQAGDNDYKSKEELEKFANETNALKIMFFVYKGQYGGEYSFLYDDEEVAKKIAKEYNQKAYAKYDDKGEYHEVLVEQLKESKNMSLEELKELVEKLYEHLKEFNVHYEIWPEDDDTISVEIDWGDWKHDHLWFDHEAEKFLNSLGYDVINFNVDVIEEDGSDTYSAIHSLQLRKRENESLDESESKDKKRLKYLLDKEDCCTLDKGERYELQDLIQKYGKPEEESLNEESLYEMAKVSKKDTNLPYDLWIDGAGKDRKNTHHSPRIKVDVNHELVPFLIDENNPDIPESVKKNGTSSFKDIELIKQYVKEYYDIFMKHWNGEISDREALNSLNELNAKQRNSQVDEFAKRWEGARVEFSYLDEYQEEEAGLEDHENEYCDIIGMTVDVYDENDVEEDNFKNCYWSIRFDDGEEYSGIPGSALIVFDDKEFDF